MEVFSSGLDLTSYGEVGMLGMLFVMLVGGAFGLPFPEDLLLLGAGIFAQQGKLHVLLLIPACVLAVVCGDLVMYILGRIFGTTLLDRPWFKKRIDASRIETARNIVREKCFYAIFVARHLFYLRGVTFFCCGSCGISLRRFLLCDLVAAAVSVSIVVGLGFTGSASYISTVQLSSSLSRISLYIGAAGFALLIIAAFFTILRKKYKQRPKNDTSASTVECSRTCKLEPSPPST